MLGFGGPPPALDELPIPPGEDELRDVICARERVEVVPREKGQAPRET